MSQDSSHQPTIYLDADACPVKDHVYKVAARYGVHLFVVANAPMRLPELPGLSRRMVIAGSEPDAADDWIASHALPGDLVLTADIPLASRVVPNGIRCLDFRGGEFTEASVVNALAGRDLGAYLRSMGLTTGGPSAHSPKDKSRFASLLDNAVSKLVRDAQKGS